MISILKKQLLHIHSSALLAGVIILMHLVGVIGFLSPWKYLFLLITPLHLMVIFSLLLQGQEKLNRSFFVFMLIVVVSSFLIEYLGVSTGLIFGNYEYGSALGLKIGGTPLLIGILWFLLISSIGAMISKIEINVYWKCFLGASLMVSIDLFIEPVAMDLGFWAWENNMIPFQNYLSWFLISFFFFFLFFHFRFSKKNQLGPVIYWSQYLFFVAINVLSIY